MANQTNTASTLSSEEVAAAFAAPAQGSPAAKKASSHKKRGAVSLAVMIIGLVVLVTGVVFLILRLARGAEVPDGEYLVSAKEWTLDSKNNCADIAPETNCADGSGVVWKFSEIGKGTLTTNNHENDYDFIWALDGNKLKIETKWLYDLENEYQYELHKDTGTLKLTAGEQEYTFTAHFESEK